MPSEFRLIKRVEFHETDMAGIMHFSNFYRYMEAAEHAFFRSLGFSIVTDIDGQAYGWPRVQAGCEFFRPLKFEDEVEIHLRVTKLGSRSIGYAFVFYKREGEQSVEVAQGTMTTVCVREDSASGGMKAVEIPRVLAERLKVAS